MYLKSVIRFNKRIYYLKESSQHNPPNLTTITSCLEHIFEYLNWTDLLNVAETCETLRSAACDFFGRRYAGNKIVRIGNVHWNVDLVTEEEIDIDSKWTTPNIILDTPLMALRVLRNFGPSILNLHISPFKVDYRFQEMEYHLANYCCHSLKHLLVTSWSLRFLDLGKPFTNIESIIAWDCKYQNDLSYSVNFPELKSLTFINNRNDNYFSKRPFSSPVLTYFSYEERKYDEGGYYLSSRKLRTNRSSDLIEILELNTQLEHLKLFGLGPQYSQALFQIIQDLPKLRHLTFSEVSTTLFQNVGHTFEFDNVQHLELRSGGVDDHILHIPLKFTNLRSLIIRTKPQQTAFDFIARHNGIKSIDLVELDGTYPDGLQFEVISPDIEELEIYHISDFCVTGFTKMLRFLKVKSNLTKFTLNGNFRRMQMGFSMFCELLCKTMTLNGVQFETRPLDYYSDGHTDWIEVEISVTKLSNLSNIQFDITLTQAYQYQNSKIYIEIDPREE